MLRNCVLIYLCFSFAFLFGWIAVFGKFDRKDWR